MTGGNKLAERESGFRIGLELFYKQPKDKPWRLAVRAKGYWGAVDYGGST
ncbi:MAG: hypothetical protein ACLQU3_13330 [Limisphaerales bacterium]